MFYIYIYSDNWSGVLSDILSCILSAICSDIPKRFHPARWFSSQTTQPSLRPHSNGKKHPFWHKYVKSQREGFKPVAGYSNLIRNTSHATLKQTQTRNKGTTPWHGREFSIIVLLEIGSGMTHQHLLFKLFFFFGALCQPPFFVLKSFPKACTYPCWHWKQNCHVK